MSGQVKIMVSEVKDTVEVSDSFKKRELWGRDEGNQYPQDWKFECVQDKVSILDDVLEGTFVTVHYNIRNRKVEKEGKEPICFTTLQAWKVEV